MNILGLISQLIGIKTLRLTKPLRVSSPLKLKKTSYFHWWVKEKEEEEDEAPSLVTIAIVIYEQRDKKIWKEEKESCEGAIKISKEREWQIWKSEDK